ncbi:Vam6/Vps39-like protein [Lamellibrachia satsuma]|nr:Vam6/Vps39-like protein [Lamellibrachia satsuma]
MHEAYEAAPILEKLPLHIESVACYNNTLLVGTKQGQLLVYTVQPTGSHEPKFSVSLERPNKAFSKKPITQLAVVPEYHILISLSDSVVSVHDLTVFAQITCLTKSRGATLFAVDLQQKQHSLGGDVQYTLRMCVAVKRKLQLYNWKNRDFHELMTDLSVPDVPKAMAWCQDSLCIGFKRDYFLIQVKSGMLKDLFPCGSNMEPLVTRLQDDRLALGRDQMTIFIDSEGMPTQKYALTWNDIPAIMSYQQPYIISVLPKYIEIRTIDPRLLIQSIELVKPRLICQCSGQVYIASSNHVWRLAPVPITTQIKDLLLNKEFELALQLANMTEDAVEEKQRRIQHIRNLFAFDLFLQHRFDESLKIFAELGTDPSHVIGLYPNLLPQDFRKQLEYPDRLPDLQGVELEKGLMALIEYLTQKRNEVNKNMNGDTPLFVLAIVEGNTNHPSKRQLGQIIDTTLLKCYLQTNDALVAPLLRLKDNRCHLEESERVLKERHKFSELIILYEKRDLHRKALDLLLRESAKSNSPLKGHDTTVQYLQRLGSENLQLIFEYAEWVIQQNPEDGLKIFTEDMPEVEVLPREQVLDYLEKTASSLIIPYLEHVIWTWNDNSPSLHNVLSLNYKNMVSTLMEDYAQPLCDGVIKAGEEPGEVGVVRAKLLAFLSASLHYQPDRLLIHFPLDGFFEERAILLGHLGRHEQALAIYVHVLQDCELALQYCAMYYDAEKEGSKDVFLHLLKMYLRPPDAKAMGLLSSTSTILVDTQPNMEAALHLLEEHANKLDTTKVLEVLPPNTRVSDIAVFLESVMAERTAQKRRCQVLKSLLYAEHLQVQEQQMFYHRMKCTITNEKLCQVCRKRISNSAFARYPNGVIVHYSCCKDKKVCPVDIGWPGPGNLDPPPTGASTVVMTTPDQEKYKCFIPPELNDSNKNVEASYEGPDEMGLLRPLLVQTSCSYRIDNYWTYELCHGKFLRQYHEEKEAGKKMKVQQYFLGYGDVSTAKDKKTSPPEMASDNQQQEHHKKKVPLQKVEGLEIPYFAIEFSGGTSCDLTGQPRRVSIHYVCQPDGKGEIYELKETSTCEYEMVVLTSLLCSHPSYQSKKDPVSQIHCHALPGSPPRPRSLENLHREKVQARYNPHDKDVRGIPRKVTTTYMAEGDVAKKVTVDVSTNKLLIQEFLNGDYCVHGGVGWWKHELCLGKKVIQFHKEQDGRMDIVLGRWNVQAHLAWLEEHPTKKPKPLSQRKTISHFYGSGDICDLTGKPRQVEVRLKCKDVQKSSDAVGIYLVEASTCMYVLVVESPILCPIIEKADDNGLISHIKL